MDTKTVGKFVLDAAFNKARTLATQSGKWYWLALVNIGHVAATTAVDEVTSGLAKTPSLSTPS